MDVLLPGALFYGRYRIIRPMKTGGMGEVYEVVDERTNGRRALKVLKASFIENADQRARFAREAHVTGAIESEHLVRVFDAGVDGDVPFLVMELLHGEELESALQKRRLPPEEVVRLLAQMARALEKTHAENIIHRDIKPANVFLVEREDGTTSVRILDFGIAKVGAADPAKKTRALGTPLYMAPEQIMGRGDIGPRADLYALAHLAYVMLTGEAYWLEDSQAEDTLLPLLKNIMAGATEPATARATRRTRVLLPPMFDAWFARATSVDPMKRFETARAEIDALATVVCDAEAPISAKSPASVAAMPVPPSANSWQPRPPTAYLTPTPPAVHMPTRVLPQPSSAPGRASALPGGWNMSSTTPPLPHAHSIPMAPPGPSIASVAPSIPQTAAPLSTRIGPPAVGTAAAQAPSQWPLVIVGAVAIAAIAATVVVLVVFVPRPSSDRSSTSDPTRDTSTSAARVAPSGSSSSSKAAVLPVTAPSHDVDQAPDYFADASKVPALVRASPAKGRVNHVDMRSYEVSFDIEDANQKGHFDEWTMRNDLLAKTATSDPWYPEITLDLSAIRFDLLPQIEKQALAKATMPDARVNRILIEPYRPVSGTDAPVFRVMLSGAAGGHGEEADFDLGGHFLGFQTQ